MALLTCIDGPDATWLADGITSVLSGDRASLDDALGLRPGPGQRSLKTQRQIQERDALYRQAAREFFPNLSKARQAYELHRRFSRYETTSWRRDKGAHVTCPERLIGTLQALAWESLSSENPVLSPERIRKILVSS